MAGEIYTPVIGRLTGDPVLGNFSDGTPYVNADVASTPRVYDRRSGEYKDGDTSFIRLVITGPPAAEFAEWARKGTRVIAYGVLTVKQWESKSGNKGQTTELRVAEIGPSQRWQSLTVTKAGGNNGGQQGYTQQQGGTAGDPFARNQRHQQQAPQGGNPGNDGGWGPGSQPPAYDEPPF